MQQQQLHTAVKASREHTRQHNRRLVLQSIASAGETSRAVIARTTNLTPPTVSSIVGDLVLEGFIDERGRAEAPSIGKPPQLLGLASGRRQTVCLDLSGSHFVGSIIDLDGSVIDSAVGEGSDLLGDRALDAARDLVAELLPKVTASEATVSIAAPGVIDESGTVRRAAYFGWNDLPLADDFEDRFGVETHVLNDAHALALAEVAAHRAPIDNLVVVRVARGVRAGIVLHGALYVGDGFGAGEIGFLVPGGAGGSIRDPEHHTSRVSIGQLVARLRGVEHTDSWDLAGAVAAADRATVAAMSTAVGIDLGRALAAVVGALDIHTVRLDPSIAPLGDELLSGLDVTLSASVVDTMAQSVDIDFGKAGPDAVLRGAAIAVTLNDLGLVQRAGVAT
ncbi:MAG: ROK family transcriptional regulator [Acidimicrobiia bacterium]|nr:ROK family transcriptional regulator [Acidimicrobiia bacterium]